MILLLRGVFLYLVLILVMRLLGKRQLGQMEPSEIAVTMLIADLAASPMEDPAMPLRTALLPIGAVLVMELLLSGLSMRSLKLRKLLCGKPVILIDNGKFLQKNLRRTRITLDELTSKLREKDVLDIALVQYAILETGGNLSVFPYPQEVPASAKAAGVETASQSLPITLISDGRLIQDNLKKSGKDMVWLSKTLKARNATIETTFLTIITLSIQFRIHNIIINVLYHGKHCIDIILHIRNLYIRDCTTR